MSEEAEISGSQETARETPWWFPEGLHFECLGCGRCCRGESGAVYLRPREEARIAALLHISLDELKKRFETDRWRWPSLRERVGGECVMHRDDGRCAIYAARPINCRTWPFWPELLASPKSWAAAARHCPGMNTGSLWTGPQIEKILAAHLSYAAELSAEWQKGGR